MPNAVLDLDMIAARAAAYSHAAHYLVKPTTAERMASEIAEDARTLVAEVLELRALLGYLADCATRNPHTGAWHLDTWCDDAGDFRASVAAEMAAADARVARDRAAGVPVGQTMTMHTLACPALLAWDIPGACTCGGRGVTLLGRLDAAADPHPFANLPPEAIPARVPRCVACGDELERDGDLCSACPIPRDR